MITKDENKSYLIYSTIIILSVFMIVIIIMLFKNLTNSKSLFITVLSTAEEQYRVNLKDNQLFKALQLQENNIYVDINDDGTIINISNNYHDDELNVKYNESEISKKFFPKTFLVSDINYKETFKHLKDLVKNEDFKVRTKEMLVNNVIREVNEHQIHIPIEEIFPDFKELFPTTDLFSGDNVIINIYSYGLNNIVSVEVMLNNQKLVFEKTTITFYSGLERVTITYLDNQFKIVYLNGNESKTYFISLKNENVTNETYFGNYNLLYENKDKELLPFNMIINVSP